MIRRTLLLALALVPTMALAQQSSSDTDANNILLGKAATLYYSTNHSGLNSFDCAVHPDWKQVFASMSQDKVSDDQQAIDALNNVKITLHARLKGGSGLDWEPAPAKPGEERSPATTALLDQLQNSTAQTLQGFMQFWTPFVDGSATPDSSEGLTVTSNPKGGFRYSLEQNGGKTTAIFNPSLVLEEFDVANEGASVAFLPHYEPSSEGLLLTALKAHIQPAGAPSQLEMQIDLTYQTVAGIRSIPAHLTMHLAGRGQLDFAFDGCTVNGGKK